MARMLVNHPSGERVPAQDLQRRWGISTLRVPAGATAAARFVLHFGEMWLAMLTGMMLFHALPFSHSLPAIWHQIGMAVFMSIPMVAWMRARGHSWRHGIEMTAGMLAPWAAVLLLVRLGTAATWPWLAEAGGPAMGLGMLATMLLRRDHATHRSDPHRHARWHLRRRTALLVTAYLSAIVLLPLVLGATNLGLKRGGGPSEPPAFSGVLPAPPIPDPSKQTAIVLASAYGSEITDTLPTFEILARSGIYNVYSVAPQRTLLPLVDSSLKPTTLGFVPHFSFAEYDARIGTPPDLIAIPYFPFYTPERDAAVLEFIRTHAGPNTTILTICAGTEILADTGLLDGHTATTNIGWFPKLEARVPSATWVRNVRYVDDGNIVTSTNLAAGMDATLHVVDRFASRARALEVARQIGYTQTGALDDPRFKPPTLNLMPILGDAAFTGPRTLGVLLYGGTSELGLAGALDPYGSSLTYRPVVLAPERTVVRSRDGLDFVPGNDFRSVPAVDRVLVPAGEPTDARVQVVQAWSRLHPGRPAEDIYQNVGQSETAYDASLIDLARVQDGQLARADADLLFYAINAGQLPETGSSLAPALTMLGLSLVGASMVFVLSHMGVLRRRVAGVA